MAGVPAIMEAMLLAVTPRLKTGPKLLSDPMRVGAPEGQIAAQLAACQQTFPDVAMGSYPYFENGRHGTNLVLRSTEVGRLRLAKADLIRDWDRIFPFLNDNAKHVAVKLISGEKCASRCLAIGS